MRKKIRGYTAVLLCMLTALSGCGAQTEQADSTGTGAESAGDTAAAAGSGDWFSDRDLSGDYEESRAVAVALNGSSAACDSDAVAIEGSRITVTAEGVYWFTGNLTDGQIVVDAADTDKVQLVLDGVDITSSTSAAIYALEADKVFVTLAEGSENTLANGGSYVAVDDNNIDAVIFAKTDLTLNGSGSLTIDAPAGHGVVSKDDLVFTGGVYTITAAAHGLSGKDSVAIAGGTFSITSEKDGIHAENSDDPTLGSLYIADGDFTIAAQGDAVSAEGALQIDGGVFQLNTGAGSASVEMPTEDTFGPMGGGRPGGMPSQRPDSGGAEGEPGAMDTPPEMPDMEGTRPEMPEGDGQRPEPPDTDAMPQPTQEAAADAAEEDTVSQKGIKGESAFLINGGSFTIDSADDSLHAGGPMTIAAGEFYLSSGDDAVHCDDALTIEGGTFQISYCYEGIEGLSITIEDGVFTITSNDDGFNAAGGADSSGFGGFGGRPQDGFAADSDCFITIHGGSITVVSSGDCVDSNGDLTVTGGTLDLTCNGNGDTALDCDGTWTHSGGDIVTNDGSEENPGQMGGGRPGGGREWPGDFGGQEPSEAREEDSLEV